jgi:hypothetical protein
MASYMSTGDIIVYQDDDDIPSCRRIEIIKHFFETQDIMCLNHSYVYNKEVPNLDNVDINAIRYIQSDEIYNKYFPNRKLEECVSISKSYGGGFNVPTCAGPVSIKREVLNYVKWKANNEISLCAQRKGEDYDFCMEVLYRFNKSIIIDVPIYSYLK